MSENSVGHINFLRSLVHVFAFNAEIKESILEAADYIDELEGQVKLLNKLGNIDSSSSVGERIAALEDRLNRMVSQMDLEQAVLQMRIETNRLIADIRKESPRGR